MDMHTFQSHSVPVRFTLTEGVVCEAVCRCSAYVLMITAGPSEDTVLHYLKTRDDVPYLVITNETDVQYLKRWHTS